MWYKSLVKGAISTYTRSTYGPNNNTWHAWTVPLNPEYELDQSAQYSEDWINGNNSLLPGYPRSRFPLHCLHILHFLHFRKKFLHFLHRNRSQSRCQLLPRLHPNECECEEILRPEYITNFVSETKHSKRLWNPCWDLCVLFCYNMRIIIWQNARTQIWSTAVSLKNNFWKKYKNCKGQEKLWRILTLYFWLLVKFLSSLHLMMPFDRSEERLACK